MSCKFFSERIYYILHIGLNQKIGICRAVEETNVGADALIGPRDNVPYFWSVPANS